jgi:DNA-binding MarR family transcriptional regulator
MITALEARLDDDSLKLAAARTELHGHPESEDYVERFFNLWREVRRGGVRRLAGNVCDEDPDALEAARIDALEVLVTAREWPMAEFADALAVGHATACAMVEWLVHAGYARRSQSSVNGRGIVTSITTRGRAEVRRAAERRREVMWEFLREASD